jgi:hypothetical protein
MDAIRTGVRNRLKMDEHSQKHAEIPGPWRPADIKRYISRKQPCNRIYLTSPSQAGNPCLPQPIARMNSRKSKMASLNSWFEFWQHTHRIRRLPPLSPETPQRHTVVWTHAGPSDLTPIIVTPSWTSVTIRMSAHSRHRCHEAGAAERSISGMLYNRAVCVSVGGVHEEVREPGNCAKRAN